jgi:hypothetical protein
VLARGRIVLELDADLPAPRGRRSLVTTPAFLALRERALEAIG